MAERTVKAGQGEDQCAAQAPGSGTVAGDARSEDLHGECDGLLELRRESGNVQFRPICCYGPERGEVALLVGAVEKGGKFVPASACSTAQDRKARLTEKGRTCDHDFS